MALLQDRPVSPEPDFPRDAAPLTTLPESSGGRRYGARFLRCWVLPYLRSRLRGGFYPIFGCVYTEWRCNLECSYCRSRDNNLPGMDESTGRRVIDWLHSSGCRVVGLTGGEPLIRPAFVCRFVKYAASKGLYVYLPTNGRLLAPELTEQLGDAGVATFNVAVDGMREKPGLPKALELIRSNFDHLVRLRNRYGYTVFLSINITRRNLEDVRLLTEFGREMGVATAYHLCEAPHGHQAASSPHCERGDAFQPEDISRVDELLDYLIECNRTGYEMVNSTRHLGAMKSLLRDGLAPWRCRAGKNMVVFRTDGTLAPCYPLRELEHDWGEIGCPKFDSPALAELQQSCTRSCFSTVAYLLADYYDIRRVAQEVAARAFRGLRGAAVAIRRRK